MLGIACVLGWATIRRQNTANRALLYLLSIGAGAIGAYIGGLIAHPQMTYSGLSLAFAIVAVRVLALTPFALKHDANWPALSLAPMSLWMFFWLCGAFAVGDHGILPDLFGIGLGHVELENSEPILVPLLALAKDGTLLTKLPASLYAAFASVFLWLFAAPGFAKTKIKSWLILASAILIFDAAAHANYFAIICSLLLLTEAFWPKKDEIGARRVSN